MSLIRGRLYSNFLSILFNFLINVLSVFNHKNGNQKSKYLLPIKGNLNKCIAMKCFNLFASHLYIYCNHLNITCIISNLFFHFNMRFLDSNGKKIL